MKNPIGKVNEHDTRESWLRAATNLLRDHFAVSGYPLPENIRFAIAFPSTGRHGSRVGECWHSSTSADGHFEIIIRADLADPIEVLGTLSHELVHTVLPADAGHGKLYRDAAVKIGLEGKLRQAMPNQFLRPMLIKIAETLGPLPHARLNIERGRDNRGPADRPKKQKTRYLKGTCTDANCGYSLRIVAKWIDEIGPPLCPKHGPVAIERSEKDEDEAEAIAPEGGEASERVHASATTFPAALLPNLGVENTGSGQGEKETPPVWTGGV